LTSKFIVLAVRLLTPKRSTTSVLTIHLGLVVSVGAVAALLSAHVADCLEMGSKDDPLGCFLKAQRQAWVLRLPDGGHC
jgi:hypothetical protein